MKSLGRSLLPILVVAIAVLVGVLTSQRDTGVVQHQAPTPTDIARVITPAPTVPITAPPTATAAPEQTVPPTAVPTDPPTVAPTVAPTQGPLALVSVPPVTGSAKIIERGNPDLKQVALTFDAGDEPGAVTQILDYLRDHQVRATFGMTGRFARANPDIVLRMVNEGHMLINHTDLHKDWTGQTVGNAPLSDDERETELITAEKEVESVTGYQMQPFFRPPYGSYDDASRSLLARHGYGYLLWWTCDSLAWDGATVAEIEKRCAPDSQYGGNGAIILMHVQQQADADAVPGLVDAYLSQGYTFVTMDQMIAEL